MSEMDDAFRNLSETLSRASRLSAEILALYAPATELHQNTEVRHIAGKGENDPTSLSPDEVRSLCGAVLRHVRRMEGKG